MKKLKQFMFSPKGTLAVFGAAIGLLLLSSIGGARAALTYYSENHVTEIRTQQIGVTLVENGESIAVSAESDSDQTGSGELLANLVGEGEKVKVGTRYEENVGVRNSGQIDQYVRVTIYKYWVNEAGEKQQQLYPGYIDLELDLDGWTKDTGASTKERTVLYYTDGPLPSGATVDLVKSLKINPEIAKIVTKGTEGVAYDYQGCEFRVRVDVDAVQTHNAKDAIRSAWGKDVTVNGDGSLSGIN